MNIPTPDQSLTGDSNPPNFLDLLAQAVGAIHPDVDTGIHAQSAADSIASGATDPDPITVVGRQNSQPAQDRQPSLPVNYPDAPNISLSNGPNAPDYGNRSQVEAARAAVANDSKPQGHLSRMLDNLGDAIYKAWGLPAYHKQEQDEKDLQNAMTGFTNNPLAAFERANTVDSKFAQDAYKNYQENQYHQGQLKSLDSNRQSEIYNRNFDNRDKGMTRVMQWTYGGLPYNQIVNAAKSYGIDESDLQQMGVTPNMTPADRKAFAYGAMNVNQQVQVPFREQALGIAQQNADAHTTNANRPRAGAAHDSTADVAVPLLRKMGQVGWDGLAPSEQQQMKSMGYSPSRGQKQSPLEALLHPTTTAPTPSSRTKGWVVKRN